MATLVLASSDLLLIARKQIYLLLISPLTAELTPDLLRELTALNVSTTLAEN